MWTLILPLYCLISGTFGGMREYGDYEDYDYEDPDNDDFEELKQSVIVSQPEKFDAKLGSTISLPCFADKPNGAPIMWSKLGSQADVGFSRHCKVLDKSHHVCSIVRLIAVGEMLMDYQLIDRVFMTETEKGSTLTISSAKKEDSGQYMCQVPNGQLDPQKLIHTVEIFSPGYAGSPADRVEVTADDFSLSPATGTIISITMIAMDTLIFVGIL